MAGGLMQLVAYGAQDVYLTGNPQITFFKVVYRRHTNFSMECIELSLNGNSRFGSKNSTCITRNGDLITNMYLMVKLEHVKPQHKAKFAWVHRIGYALIKSVEVQIGGSKIDKQYGTWLNIWYELARNPGHIERGFKHMIGDVDHLTAYNNHRKPEYKLHIPLKFWFNRHAGLALPLIALQYHEVRLEFEFHEHHKLIVANEYFKHHHHKHLHMKDVQLLVDYIYLDSEERRRFAQVGHEYLIEQVQYTGEESVRDHHCKHKLDFNHPTKELIWAIRNGHYITGKKFLYYTHKKNWHHRDVIHDAARKILRESLALIGHCKHNGPDVVTEDRNHGDNDDSSSSRFSGGGSGSRFDSGSSGGSWGDSGSDYSSSSHHQKCHHRCRHHEHCCDESDHKPDCGEWEEFGPEMGGTTTNRKIYVRNESKCKSLWISTHSLKVCGDSLTNRIEAEVIVPEDARCHEDVIINIIEAHISVRDLSVPAHKYEDTRARRDDPHVHTFTNYGCQIDGHGNPVEHAIIQLNGQDRFDRRDGDYFNYVQPYQHHTNIPCDGINVYSFALHPEQHQPSGSCNLSRIDNTQLSLWLHDRNWDHCGPELRVHESDSKLYIYAFSYNVLRIMSGMGGLAYSN
jgi:hypothetical protein